MALSHLTSGLNHFQIFDLQAVMRLLYPLDAPQMRRTETGDWTAIAQSRLFSNPPGELAVPYIYILHVICPLVSSACSPRLPLLCCVCSWTAATTCVAILPQHLPPCGTKCALGTSANALPTQLGSAAAVRTLALALALNKTFSTLLVLLQSVVHNSWAPIS